MDVLAKPLQRAVSVHGFGSMLTVVEGLAEAEEVHMEREDDALTVRCVFSTARPPSKFSTGTATDAKPRFSSFYIGDREIASCASTCSSEASSVERASTLPETSASSSPRRERDFALRFATSLESKICTNTVTEADANEEAGEDTLLDMSVVDDRLDISFDGNVAREGTSASSGERGAIASSSRTGETPSGEVEQQSTAPDTIDKNVEHDDVACLPARRRRASLQLRSSFPLDSSVLSSAQSACSSTSPSSNKTQSVAAQTDTSVEQLHSDLEELMSLDGAWLTQDEFQLGDVVRVEYRFLSIDQVSLELLPGFRGCVASVDEDGDARIMFPILGKSLNTMDASAPDLPYCWVQSSNFAKLSVLYQTPDGSQGGDRHHNKERAKESPRSTPHQRRRRSLTRRRRLVQSEGSENIALWRRRHFVG